MNNREIRKAKYNKMKKVFINLRKKGNGSGSRRKKIKNRLRERMMRFKNKQIKRKFDLKKKIRRWR